MCGYEICIHYKQLQRTLNSWRKRRNCNKHRYKFVVLPDDNILHLSPRDEINGMLCPIKSGFSLPKWNYVFRRCMS